MFARIMNRIRVWWEATRERLAVLSLNRFSLLIPGVLITTLIASDQMADVLLALGQDIHFGAILWLVITSTFCALVVWYTARTMLAISVSRHPRIERTEPCDAQAPSASLARDSHPAL